MIHLTMTDLMACGLTGEATLNRRGTRPGTTHQITGPNAR